MAADAGRNVGKGGGIVVVARPFVSPLAVENVRLKECLRGDGKIGRALNSLEVCKHSRFEGSEMEG